MVLEEVWKMRRERFRFFCAEMDSRFRSSLPWCPQAAEQGWNSRSTWRNKISASSAATALTIMGSPAKQAYVSAKTAPGPTLSSTLLLPQTSSFSIWTRPESTSPRAGAGLPAARMTAPLGKDHRRAPRQSSMAGSSSTPAPWNRGERAKISSSMFPPLLF